MNVLIDVIDMLKMSFDYVELFVVDHRNYVVHLMNHVLHYCNFHYYYLEVGEQVMILQLFVVYVIDVHYYYRQIFFVLNYFLFLNYI